MSEYDLAAQAAWDQLPDECKQNCPKFYECCQRGYLRLVILLTALEVAIEEEGGEQDNGC